MKILVTGGAGFIGSHTVIELIAAGHEPVIVDDFSNSKEFIVDRLSKIAGKKIPVYKKSYQDIEAINNIIKQEQISGIIHFAAHKAVGESVANPLKYYENNVSGLIGLLQSIDKYSLDKPLVFVFSSSCTVYGEPDSLPVTEESPTKPAASPYGATKQMGEKILEDYATLNKNVRAVSLRYFNPIGAHSSGLIGELPLGTPANLVPFITQTAAGIRKNLTVYGDDYPTKDGSCIRDYIHVVDLAKAHVRAIEYLNDSKVLYDVFNIGTGKGSSVLEVVKLFEKVTNKKLAYTIGPRRPGDIVSTYASVEKAEKILKWKAEKTLEDALADSWRWQESIGKTT